MKDIAMLLLVFIVFGFLLILGNVIGFVFSIIGSVFIIVFTIVILGYVGIMKIKEK